MHSASKPANARPSIPGPAVCCASLLGKSHTPSSGVNNTATTQETSSDTAITTNSVNVNSPAELALRPTGMKPATVTNVPVNMGNAVVVYTAVAALVRVSPASSLATIISTAIMASSTNRPSAMISAPREMRCIEMPRYCITLKVIASTIGIASATTKPARRPKLTKLTASTITTASNSARTKPDTASSTTAGWSDTK